MPTTATGLTDRAKHIARGLIKTRRATRGVLPSADAEFARLPTVSGGEFYWLAVDGSQVRRGNSFVGSVELQRGFVDAMARAGA
jgi:hypothetical protein